MRTLLSLVIVLFFAIPSSAGTIHVPEDQPTIQAGIDAASAGDTVLVACGTYYEYDILMKSGVYLTSETGLADCATIDAGNIGQGLLCFSVDSTASICGFNILNGFASSEDFAGGGFLFSSSALVVKNCEVVSCSAPNGGGIAGFGGSVIRFENCAFVNNVAFGNDAYGDGGCGYWNGNRLTMVGCRLEGNSGNEESGKGGGLTMSGGSSPSFYLFRCEFIENRARFGGAIESSAPGMYLEVDHCLFFGNTAGYGGAIEQERGLCSISASTFQSNAAIGPGGAIKLTSMTGDIVDCRILDNNSSSEGGGIQAGAFAALSVERCVIAGNSASVGGGLAAYYSVSLDQCTITYNIGASGGGLWVWSNDIWASSTIISFNLGTSVHSQTNGSYVLTCTDVYGNSEGDYVGPIADQLGQDGNISQDPLFCDPESEDFSVADISPCLPENNDCGVLMGVYSQGCTLTSADSNPGLASGLEQNFPNPFNPSTVIRFNLPEAAQVSLSIYDFLGRRVMDLLMEDPHQPGMHSVTWKGTDSHGEVLPSGIYFCKLRAGDDIYTRRMTLLK